MPCARAVFLGAGTLAVFGAGGLIVPCVEGLTVFCAGGLAAGAFVKRGRRGDTGVPAVPAPRRVDAAKVKMKTSVLCFMPHIIAHLRPLRKCRDA